MRPTSDAVVVGGGVLGASVACHLALRGLRDVVVCEQGSPPGLGATVRSGGLLRRHHTARCDIALAARSLPVFQRWAEAIGGDCGYRPCGLAVLVAPGYAGELGKNVAAVNEAGGRSEILTAGELRALHPGLRPPGDALAAYEADGGYGDPAATTLALLARAEALGARVGEGLTVRAILTAGDRVTGVRTNVGRIDTPLVVLAAGAWSAPLAAGVGVDVPVEPRRIGLARARAGLAGGDLPACIDDTTGAYFRPGDAGAVYFGVPCDPDVDVGGHPEPLGAAEVAVAKAHAAAHVPALGPATVDGTRAGFDAYTPDRRPVIGPAGPAGLYVCTGFSGGGFKMAPAAGELVAAELVEGTRQELLDPYRPGRFAAGALIDSENPYARL